MLVEELHQPASHAVKQFVLNVLPSVVEEQCVSPLFADVALVSGADLPAQDIVFVEQVELLVTNHPDQDELIVDFAAPSNPLELGAFHLELLSLQLCHFLRQILHIRLPRDHIRGRRGCKEPPRTRLLLYLIGGEIRMLLQLRACLSYPVPDPQQIKQAQAGILWYLVCVQVDRLQCE